ncbi:hypothetical protein LL965_22715, partial [Xanthomonas cassavae CFBP 4642]
RRRTRRWKKRSLNSTHVLHLQVETAMLDGREPLTTTSDAIATRMFAAGLADPVTGQDLSNVSAAGVVVYLKAVYDRLHNEAAAALPPAIA